MVTVIRVVTASAKVKKMSKGLEIPMEVADGITVACLTEQLNYLEKDQEEFRETIARGEKIESHKEADWLQNNKMIYHITEVLKYYGVDV